MDKKIAIQAALTRQLFTASKIAQVASVILAALLAYMQRDEIDSEVVLAWGFMIVLVALLRTALAIAYQRSDTSDNSATHSWLIRFRFGVLVSGIAWGSASILLFPANNPQHQMFLVFILAGLTAGALVSYSADLISAIAFLVSVILPLIIRLFVAEDSVSVAMSTALILYLGFMIMSLKEINRNVSENVTLHLEAAEREAFQSSLLDAIPIPVFYKDRDGRYLGFNKAYETFLGTTRDQLIGKSVFDISPPELAKIYHAKDAELIESGEMQQYESQVKNTQGVLRDVRFNKAVFADGRGATGGLIGAILDITERKQAEATLLHLNAELEQRVAQRTAELETAVYDLENFNYSASHDLRIPLRAVDGFSKILLDEYSQQLDDEGRRMLNVVRDNTRKMAQFIDDMQEFSRTGHAFIVLTEISMDELVREVVAELRPGAAGRELKLEIHDLPPAFADRHMMRQVMVNLLSNAIKFTRPKAAALIEVGARTEDHETVYYVSDNGVGFDMQYANKLFGVFQRLHGPTEFEGTGIGLAIVKRIITRLGGKVWADGKVNEGATIYFALPVKETSLPPEQGFARKG